MADSAVTAQQMHLHLPGPVVLYAVAQGMAQCCASVCQHRHMAGEGAHSGAASARSLFLAASVSSMFRILYCRDSGTSCMPVSQEDTSCCLIFCPCNAHDSSLPLSPQAHEDMRNVLGQHCLHCNSPGSVLAITIACLPSGPLIRLSCCQQQTCRLAGMLYKSSSSALSAPSCSGSSLSFLFPSRFLSCSSMYFSLQEQILQSGLSASRLCGPHQSFPELPLVYLSF